MSTADPTSPAPAPALAPGSPDVAAAVPPAAGTGPWRQAAQRLRRNKVAIAGLLLFVLLVASALLAPVWSSQVAGVGPSQNNLSAQIQLDGKTTDVVSLDGIPIGPTYGTKFFLGADQNGRDIMVRLLYGGRNSLMIGFAAAVLTVVAAVLLGLLAGFFRGRTDSLISRGLDVLWSFPVIILGVALGVALAIGGLDVGRIVGLVLALAVVGLVAAAVLGGAYAAVRRRPWRDALGATPVVLGAVLAALLVVLLVPGASSLWPFDGPTVSGSSLLIPVGIIGVVYVPYLARPIRGQVLSLREKEFVEAARAQGAGSWRIMSREILPNLATTIIVFLPLIIANAILLEASLSFLGAGVQPPNPSWGTMIAEGVQLVSSAPHLAVAPGLMLVLTVLSLNVFGDGVRDAIDPRATVRTEG